MKKSAIIGLLLGFLSIFLLGFTVLRYFNFVINIPELNQLDRIIYFIYAGFIIFILVGLVLSFKKEWQKIGGGISLGFTALLWILYLIAYHVLKYDSMLFVNYPYLLSAFFMLNILPNFLLQFMNVDFIPALIGSILILRDSFNEE
jgi:hypothetical protein